MTHRTTNAHRRRGAIARTVAPLALAASLLLGVSSVTTSANAQAVCVQRGELANHLGKSYAEQPVAIGLASNGHLMEVFSSREGDTWTLIFTMPNGVSCVAASGESWTEVTTKVAGEIS